MKPYSIIYLSSFSCELDYSHVTDFTSLQAQENYFLSLNNRIFTNYLYQRKTNSIKLDINIDDAKKYNYIFYSNLDGKIIYNFIIDREYINENTTIIYMKLDVWQTYLFDYTLKESFVDRCHVDRWIGNIPTQNMIDEGLPLQEYIIDTIEDIYTYNNGLIFSSTQPLGYCKGFHVNNGTGGSGGGTCGDWSTGILSPKGFRFVKGYEAFAPYHYDDGYGYLTIAYGVTLHGEPELYNELLALEPVPEETGARKSYDLKNNNYGKKILDACKRLGVKNQNEFDALVSLAFNCGNGVVTGSNSLTDAILTGDPNNIRNVWEQFYITSNGEVSNGLIARRKAECDVFLLGLYEFRPIPLLDANGDIIGVIEENRGDGWLPSCADTGKVDNELGLWTIPTSGTITATFPTYPSGGVHSGIDIGNELNTPIYASRGGIAEVQLLTDSYGKHVKITHDGNILSIYGHMNEVTINNGDTVQEGQQIGKMGTTGNSTGVHLHFEIRNNLGVAINPMPTFKVGDRV